MTQSHGSYVTVYMGILATYRAIEPMFPFWSAGRLCKPLLSSLGSLLWRSYRPDRRALRRQSGKPPYLSCSVLGL